MQNLLAVRAVAIAFMGSFVLLASVSLYEVGPTTARAAIATALDEAHVSGPRTRWWREARRLETADAVHEATRAVETGDRRLVGLATVGPYLPGTDDRRYTELERRFGVRFLAAGCVISSEEEGRFRSAAFAYAVRYNQTVLRLLQWQ